MKIVSENFSEKMKYLKNLMGWTITPSRITALYGEIYKNYQLEDFERTFLVLKGEDRFNTAKFFQLMGKYRGERLEREAHERQELEDEESKTWKKQYINKDATCGKKDQAGNYQCFNCDQPDPCPVHVNACIKAINTLPTEKAMMDSIAVFKGILTREAAIKGEN